MDFRNSEKRSSDDMAAVLERVRPQLKTMIRRHRISLPDSEDLVQDALLALVTKWATIREPGSWLVGALRHLCHDYVRRRQRSRVAAASGQLERLAGAAPSGEERHCARLDSERWVRELTPGQRRLLRLNFGLGLDVDELARLLGGVRPASLRQHGGARSHACAN